MFQSFIAAQKDNAVLWLPVFLGTGIALYFSLPFEPAGWIGMASCLLTLCVILLVKHIGIRLVCCAILLIGFGFTCAQLRTMIVTAPILDSARSSVVIEGTIRSLDDLGGNRGTRVILSSPRIEGIPIAETPEVIRISVRKDDKLMPGQRINVLVGLTPPAAPISPDGYDFQRHAFFQKIGAYGFAYKEPRILTQTTDRWLERFRQRGDVTVQKIVPAPESSIVSALLLGKRAAIPEDSWEDIRAAGLAHVISISGLHISMIAIGVFFVARFIMALFPIFALHHPIKKYAAFLALLACVAYSVMVGFTVPTVRSMLMTGLVMTAIMIDRNPFSLRLVALAAFLILIIQPESLMNPGFQMSFAAVIALIFFFEQSWHYWTSLLQNDFPPWLRRITLGLIGAIATSVIATLATTPFTLYHFQQFPIYSVIGNIAALPPISFVIMPAAVIAYILMPFGWEYPAIWLMGKGVTAMLAISHEVASWQYASLDLVTWPLSAMICFVLAGIWGMAIKGKIRFLAALPFCIAIILINTYHPPDIMISSNARLVMVRASADTAWLSTKRSDKFTAENWLRAAGINAEKAQTWPPQGSLQTTASSSSPASPSQYPPTSLHCDPMACHLHIKNHLIAFVMHPHSFAEDCAMADMVITLYHGAQDSCDIVNQQPQRHIPVISPTSLQVNGAHSIRISDKNIDITNVASKRGARPWTLSGAAR